MRTRRSLPRRLALVVSAVAIAAAWFTWLRPTTLGGRVSYVIVDGSSMEPTYDDGDLVLVREQESYTSGDVIAFRAGGTFDDPTRIIHRIIGESAADAFVTQGDNRDEIDPWQPGPDDIIGRAVFHVPMAGSIAGFVTQPLTFAAMGAGAVAAGGGRRRRRRRSKAPTDQRDGVTPPHQHVRRERSSPPRPPRLPPRWDRLTHPRWAFFGLILAALLVVPVLGLAWSSLRAPDATQRVEVVGQVETAIGIDYRFRGEESAVYPSGVVEATATPAGAVVVNEPLYTRLLDEVEVDLAFRGDQQGADDLVTTYTVEVVAETPDGWSTRLDSVETQRFSGETAETVVVGLDETAARVLSVASLTGIGGDAYTVTITPRLFTAASYDASSVESELAAPVTINVEGNVITAQAVERRNVDQLTRTIDEEARYSVGPFDMDTQLARGTLSGLALVLVAGIAWFASVLFGGLGLGESARIAARYRSQIVDVSSATAPPGPVVMVSAIEELVRIAKLEQAVILHEDLGDGSHRYRVFLGAVTYEYETAPEHPGSAQPAEVSSSSIDEKES